MDVLSYNAPERTEIQLGDRVSKRLFLFFGKKFGNIVYVPGVSPFRKDMETLHGSYICVRYDNGSYERVLLNTDGVLFDKGLRYEGRGEAQGLQPTDKLDDDVDDREELDARYDMKRGIKLVACAEKRLSKLGGLPNLPEGMEWPKNPDGVELDLLAQIHCPEAPEGLGLPSTGTLFFFYDVTEMPWGLDGDSGESWRVVYTDAALSPEVRQRSVPREDYDDGCERYVELVEYESHASDGFDSDSRQGVHVMLGYPDWIQRDLDDDKRTLLLQLDSDTALNPAWMWCNGGRLFFMIEPHDLEDGAFDKTRMVLECY